MRGILAGCIAAAAVLAAAGPANAKCGHGGVPCPDPVRLRVTVDGPDLAAPLVIRDRDAWSILNVTGVNYRPYNVFDRPPARLGPRFEVMYRFTQGDRRWLLYQDVYPYAAGRPFAFTPSGQRFVDRYAEPVEAEGGWRGSRTLETILRAHGLPGAPPAGATTSAAGVVTLPRNDAGGDPTSWAWVAVGAALLSLGGLAARWGFRRRSVRAPV